MPKVFPVRTAFRSKEYSGIRPRTTTHSVLQIHKRGSWFYWLISRRTRLAMRAGLALVPWAPNGIDTRVSL